MLNEVEFKFEVPGCGHEFRVEGFQVNEELSKPFHINLSLLSLDPDISFDELIRKAGVLTLYGQGAGAARVFNGVVNEVRFLGTGRRFSRYQLVLVPQAWFLTQRQDCRIFQQKSAQDIITEVLDDGSVTDYRFELSGVYPPKEYVLQYRETDLQFVQRILAEHGMWYYFDHSEANHTMVIVDSNDAIIPLANSTQNASYAGPIWFHSDGGGAADREHITDLELVNRVRTGEVTYTDYNYETPKIPQAMTQAGNLDSDLKLFDYPGRYFDPAMGMVRTTEWMSEHVVDNQQIEASSDVMRFASGYSFEIMKHPRDAINRDYIMLSVVHVGQDPQVHEDENSGMPTTYYNQFTCIPRDIVYKAPKMAAPVVEGPQTAVVVGPAGEEIYTDNLGRIKVQFHWDRYGNNDENSGCWIRVSQSMAAPNWGAVYLPRIGHEVVITFLEGDPDRPLVTGAVYNGLHFPPYALPENKTRTTFRTQTHKGTGYNELSFEDEANQEEVYIHAQKDMSTKVLNNRYRDIGQDEFLKVARNQTNDVYGDHKEMIDGHKTTQVNSTFTETVEQDVTVTYNANEKHFVKNNSDLEIGDNRTTKIGKNDDLDIGQNSNLTVGASKNSDVGSDDNQTVGGNLTVSVKGNTSYKADGATQIISGDKIVLKTGGSSLVMTSDGSIKLSGSSITIEGSDKVAIKGGSVAIN
ncbi:type VI secretion system Vgr family protein [Vibrio sagamiensis]|uniref:Type VI secretion protein VgrG n=1 Tax=Vibrio sagamiensis NBRC 104589 TaxID=1219064 RepID=A0A511QD98_9VIBR|nr:type VI secretion system tip protein VgrG [Vibrio sagamiensis]PNQ55643.1 type VI secretion system tip protein VgrG [Vibrio agarivorans]GEM75147.1 type VI secretion protein VgrG [Vibrio sagamiensis NBRC 104589]